MTALARPASENAATRLEKLARLHLWALGGALALVLLAAWRVPGLALAPLLLTIGILAAFNLGVLVFLRRRGALQLPAEAAQGLPHAQIVLDIFGLTLFLYFAGGAENPFFPFYVFPVILAAALLGRRAAYGYTLLAVLLYGLVLVAGSAGILPHHPLLDRAHASGWPGAAQILSQTIALLAICLVSAAATALMMEAVQSRARELAESRQRAEVRAAHMRDLNEQLRRTADECRHQREHLDAAYIELQHAHDRLSVRSSQLSELNEQLRRANAECKSRREDLERLNAELARGEPEAARTGRPARPIHAGHHARAARSRCGDPELPES